jgi:hypothetical protein
MNAKPRTHRIVTFLTRDEMDFLDKLEKDMMFSGGKSVSRSQIIEDLTGILKDTRMDASGIQGNEALKQKIMQAIADFVAKEKARQEGR